MKSYTDLEQSKTLEKILPIESADMWYWEFPTAPTYNGYGFPMFHKGEDIRNVPCWSLVALLSVLPYPHLEQNYKGKWYCRTEYADTTYLWEADNPVDACYEMILKLHEQKLL